MEHKNYVLPEIDLSHDGGDPRHIEHGETTPLLNEAGEVYAYQWNGLAPGHYADYYQLCVVDCWAETVRNYETNPADIYHAWWYVDGHPVFWSFRKNIHPEYPVNHVSNLEHSGALTRGWPEITPHMVNPRTGHVADDEAENTTLEWWYEFGPTNMTGEDGFTTHDWELDGGCGSYEDCVVEIALKIHDMYGNDRVLVDDESYWAERQVPYGHGGAAAMIEKIRNERR